MYIYIYIYMNVKFMNTFIYRFIDNLSYTYICYIYASINTCKHAYKIGNTHTHTHTHTHIYIYI